MVSASKGQKILISETPVKAKAKRLAYSIDKNNFKAGISRFANSWKDDLLQMVSNRDATFLTLTRRSLHMHPPTKHLRLKKKDVVAGHSKVRIALVGPSMDGSEKLSSLMIGKSTNSRSFKNIKRKPVKFESNNKAWVTSEIFQRWHLKIDRKFRKRNRRIVLFIANCTAHNTVPVMKM